MIQLDEFIKNPSPEILEFKHYADVFKIDYDAKKAFNKLLGTKWRAVYLVAKDRITGSFLPKKIDLGCETIYAIREDGKVICFTNSEWGGIDLCN